MNNLIKEKFNYFHREYNNDVELPQEEGRYTLEGQLKRSVVASLPFLSLYAPVGKAQMLLMSSARIYTNLVHLTDSKEYKDVAIEGVQTLISVGSLASSIFAHPLGMIVTTGQDIGIEFRNLYNHIEKGNRQEALSSIMKIFNNGLYMLLLTKGGGRNCFSLFGYSNHDCSLPILR